MNVLVQVSDQRELPRVSLRAFGERWLTAGFAGLIVRKRPNVLQPQRVLCALLRRFPLCKPDFAECQITMVPDSSVSRNPRVAAMGASLRVEARMPAPSG